MDEKKYFEMKDLSVGYKGKALIHIKLLYTKDNASGAAVI